MEYKLESAPCYYCSTTEGEPELYPTKVTLHSTPQPSILHLYPGAMMRDLTVEQHLNGMDQCSTDTRGVSSEFHAIITSHHPPGEGQPADTMDCIQHELQNLLIAIHQPHPPAPAEPLREVIQQYTVTLCTTQKQSNLTNSLLQDIPAFNEHNSTKLEDWLTDIEMAADLPVKAEPGSIGQSQGD